jgi:glyceraldehyde-3-phosphate dehydrogenase, type I
MVLRLAINGFGRIGRLAFRIACEHPEIHVVAINDIVDKELGVYLLTHDSTHGKFKESVLLNDTGFTVKGKNTVVLSEKNPADLPWKELNVDYVLESTGKFTDLESLQAHLHAGAKRVILSAPAKGDIPTLVMGVNEASYNPSKDSIVSNASCTTNCLAPLVKVIQDVFGVEEALMTTIHAVTATQPTVDGPSKKDWRGGRGALQNLIPSSTGAAKAVTQCLPSLKGKLTGMAVRVPVADVSLVDLTVRTSKATTYDEISKALFDASRTNLKGILDAVDDDVVSSDFIGSRYSCVFDKRAGIALNDRFFKLLAWYDNEMGYSARLVDLMLYMASKE